MITESPADPLSIRVVQELRRRIITGTYDQGERLPEQRLAEELAVSRIPLREALRQLEVEGFVQSTPRRGVVVRRWTTQSVHDLFDTRLAIEPYAARLAARRAGRGADLRLVELVTASEKQLRVGDTLRMWEINAEFHRGVVDSAGNELLSGLMTSVSGRMVWLFYLTAWRDAVLACSEHGAITAAIEQGNDQLAEALMFAHIEAGRAPTLESLAPILAD